MGLREELAAIDPDALTEVAITLGGKLGSPDGADMRFRFHEQYPNLERCIAKLAMAGQEAGHETDWHIIFMTAFVLLGEYANTVEIKQQFGDPDPH